jgi:hypothetical protein
MGPMGDSDAYSGKFPRLFIYCTGFESGMAYPGTSSIGTEFCLRLFMRQISKRAERNSISQMAFCSDGGLWSFIHIGSVQQCFWPAAGVIIRSKAILIFNLNPLAFIFIMGIRLQNETRKKHQLEKV